MAIHPPEDLLGFLGQPELPMEPFNPPQFEPQTFMQPPGRSYLDRLALAFQDLQMQRPQNDLQGAIQGLVQGFGAARGGGVLRREQQVEEQNKRLSEGARLMAQQRWQNYQAQTQQLRGVRESQRAQAAADVAARRDQRDQDRMTETERHNRSMEGLTATRLTGQPAIDDVNVAAVAQAAAAGQYNSMGEVPAGKNGSFRGAVTRHMRDNGLAFTPKKVRDATADIEVGRGLITEFKRMSEKVNRGEGTGRFGTGAQNLVTQFTQAGDPDIANYPATRKGLSSYISRLSGQVGVLTDRDVAAAIALIPSQWDARTAAINKLDRLSGFLESKFEAFRKAHTTTNLGVGGPQTVQKWGRDASGRPVRIQ